MSSAKRASSSRARASRSGAASRRRRRTTRPAADVRDGGDRPRRAAREPGALRRGRSHATCGAQVDVLDARDLGQRCERVPDPDVRRGRAQVAADDLADPLRRPARPRRAARPARTNWRSACESRSRTTGGSTTIAVAPDGRSALLGVTRNRVDLVAVPREQLGPGGVAVCPGGVRRRCRPAGRAAGEAVHPGEDELDGDDPAGERERDPPPAAHRAFTAASTRSQPVRAVRDRRARRRGGRTRPRRTSSRARRTPASGALRAPRAWSPTSSTGSPGRGRGEAARP